MIKKQHIAAAAFDAGAAVRAAGRALTESEIYRNPKLHDLIKCAGWSAVWGSAVQGWAAENRRRAPSNNVGRGVGHE